MNSISPLANELYIINRIISVKPGRCTYLETHVLIIANIDYYYTSQPL